MSRTQYIDIVDCPRGQQPNSQDYFTYNCYSGTMSRCFRITTEWDNLVMRLQDIIGGEIGVDEPRRNITISLLDRNRQPSPLSPTHGLGDVMRALQAGYVLVWYRDPGRQARDVATGQGYYDGWGVYMRQ